MGNIYGGVDQYSGQQYGNSPQPAYQNQAQQYGNSPQPAYPNQAQQYGNSPQPAYHNQAQEASNVYGGVNQYSGQPKPGNQQSYQQQSPNVNAQQASPIQQTMAVNDHGAKYNQYSSPAAGQHKIASQSYAGPAIYLPTL